MILLMRHLKSCELDICILYVISNNKFTTTSLLTPEEEVDIGIYFGGGVIILIL